MVIVQFGFNPDDPRNPHHPGNHVENRIAYTGTHDHDTVRGWYESIDGEVRAMVDAAIEQAGVREPEPWWSLIRLALASPARVAMVQAQDVLGLGGEARMNMPGTTGKSWRWALDALPSAELGRRLRDAGARAGRI
jgi:4-alpha-glucanotransferase